MERERRALYRCNSCGYTQWAFPSVAEGTAHWKLVAWTRDEVFVPSTCLGVMRRLTEQETNEELAKQIW